MYKVLNVDGYEKMAEKYKISSIAAKALVSKNIEISDKIKEKKSYEYENMDSVVSFILKAISDKKKIAIYGDYDADGICSVSILYRTFSLLNYNVGYYVPNRYGDGYGLSSNIVTQMNEKGYKLLICVDNGIKAHKSIELARSYGIDVIVLDHHQKDETFPDFNLYLHPQYSSFSEYNMCGASICYYLSIALLGYEDERVLALAGIATIGDVMPLVGQNKLIAAKALKYLNKFKYKAIDLLNKEEKKYDENLVAMQIVPKLNSVGRICKDNTANKIVNYLTSDNEKELKIIAQFIESTNDNRKKMTEDYFLKIDKGSYDNKVIIEKDDSMLEGINGIVASKFSNKYHLPTIIFSLDTTGNYYKGSARSIDDFDILSLFKENEYVEVYGGHKGAAGLTIKREDYEHFKIKVIELTKENIYNESVLEVIEIDRSELSFKAYLDLQKLAPFGEGNPSPLFLIRNVKANEFNKSRDGKHILLSFDRDVNFVGFNLANEIKNDICYDIIFKLELNNLFGNKITCKCIGLGESQDV